MNPSTYTYKYPRPSVTTDCVVFGFDGQRLNVLLIERGIEPFKGRWALPGGFMKMDETLDECAHRELYEETGLEVASDHIRQFAAFSALDRDPRERVVTVAYYALVPSSDVTGGDDAARAQWFPFDAVPSLAFDHDQILRAATAALRHQIHFEPVGFRLLDQCFTMPQLQRLYEAILGVKFDRRNFQKKMLHLGLLNIHHDTVENRNRKLSQLYSFNGQQYEALKQSGFMLEF